MRRVLLALFLACAGIVLTEMPAHACRCIQADTATQARKANAVFAGTITSMQTPAGRGEIGTVTFTVSVDRAYKNTVPDTVEVQTPASPTACGLAGLESDRRYVFFGELQGDMVQANSCGGTAPASEALLIGVEAALGPGTSLAGTSAQSTVQLRKLDDAEPTSFGRLAAPGGALAIVGLLGLLVVRRLGRA